MKKFLAFWISIVLLLSCCAFTTAYAAASGLTKLKSGAKIDLNGDKKTEAISWKFGLKSGDIDGDYTSFLTLKVGSKSISLDGTYALFESDSMYKCEPEVYYGDIDTADKYKELFVVQFDRVYGTDVYILRYDGKKITRAKINSLNIDGDKHTRGYLFVNSVEGIYKNDITKMININGKGDITSTNVCDMMGTWDLKEKYTLDKNSFSFNQQLFATHKMNIKTKTCKDVTYRVSSDKDAKKAILKKGTALTFVLTDQKNWVKFTTSNGKTGYIRIYFDYGIVLADSGEEDWEVFDNLPYSG